MRALFSIAVAISVTLNSPVFAEKTTTQEKPQTSSKNELVLLIAMPVDASGVANQKSVWFSGLSEQLLHYRLSASDRLDIISVEKLRTTIAGRTATAQDYKKLAKALNATHIVQQNYEISRDGKSVSSLFEVVAVRDGQVVSLEQTIALERSMEDLDNAAMWIFKSVGVTPDNELNRFFSIPAVPAPYKDVEELGTTAATSVVGTKAQMLAAAGRYQALADRDSRNMLAQYLAAKAYEQAGEHYKAASMLKDILAVIPNHKALYIDICRNYRQCDMFKEVLSYAAAAESKQIKSYDLLLEGGLAFEAMGRLEKARRVFEAVLSEEAQQPEALLFFAREYNRKGNYQEAINLADKILANDKNNGHAHFERGKALALTGKKDKALNALEKSVEILPNEAAPRRLLADMYSEAAQYEKAARHYTYMLNDNPKFYSGHIWAAEAWQKAGNTKEAAAILVRAERLFPDSLNLQRRIGLLEHALHNDQNAVLHLERFVKEGEPDAEVLMILGDIYAESAKYERALYMYNHAMPLMKDKKPCRFALASYHMKTRDYKAAISHLLDILKEDQKYPKVHRMLADAWYALGTTTEALTCYKKTRELEGNDAFVQERIARITFDAGNFPVAAGEYRALVKLDSANALAYFRLAIIALEQNSERQAEGFLLKAQALGKPDEKTSFMLGCGYHKVGNPRKAIAAYLMCLAKNATNEQAMRNLSEAYLKVNDKAAAAEYSVKLFALDNDRNQDFLAKAGLLYEEANMVPKAQELYRQFVSKGYKNPDVNLHLAHIEYRLHMHQKVIDLLAGLDKTLLGQRETVRMLGVSHFKTKRYPDAIFWLESAVVNEPADAELVEMLAVSYESENHLDKARQTYGSLTGLVSGTKETDIAYHIGELYEKENKQGEAVARYRQNIVNYPDDMRSYERLVALLLDRQDLTSARDVLEKAVVRAAAKPSFLKALADVCAQQNDRMAAVRRYQKYLKLVPSDFSAWRSMGDIYFAKRMYDKAAEALAQAAGLKPADFSTQFTLAQAYRETGGIEPAIDAAKKAHEIQPNDSDVLVILADCYRTTDKRIDLIAALEKLALLRPGDFDTKYELGNLLLASNKTEEGVKVLEDACTMRPKNTDVHVILARAYESLKNNDARLSHLKAALDADEGYAEAHYEMGRLYAGDGRTKKADKHFAQALQINPEHTPTLYAYSALLYSQGTVEQPFEHMTRAVKLDPYVVDYKVLYAQLAWEMKKADLAVETINAALAIDEKSVAAMSVAGLIYKETGRIEEAKAILTRAIAIDQNCADCYRYLAEIHFDESDYARAIGYFRRSLDIAGYNERTAVRLARAYKLSCQDEKARVLFEDVLAKNPDQYESFYQLTDLAIRSDRIDEAKAMVGKRRREQKTVWHHLAAGEIQEIEGKTDAALISYSVALRLMPDIPEAHSGLGRIDLTKDDFANAIVNFGKALARDPYNPYLMLDMARAYEGTGEYNSAFEIYKEVSGKYPQVAEAYYRFAQLNSRLKEHMKAMEIVEEGLEHNPKNPRLLMGLGHACRMLGRYQEAIDAYEQAVKKGGQQYVDAYIHIANVYSKYLNDEETAKRYQKKYLKAGGEEETLKKQIAVLE